MLSFQLITLWESPCRCKNAVLCFSNESIAYIDLKHKNKNTKKKKHTEKNYSKIIGYKDWTETKRKSIQCPNKNCKGHSDSLTNYYPRLLFKSVQESPAPWKQNIKKWQVAQDFSFSHIDKIYSLMYWKRFWFWQEISPKKFENYFLYSSKSEIGIYLFHLPRGRIGQIYPIIARILLEGNFSVAAGKKWGVRNRQGEKNNMADKWGRGKQERQRQVFYSC